MDKYNNCVFLSCNEKGQPVSAFLRGTCDREGKAPFKFIVQGSDERYGFIKEGSILIFEACIDLVSLVLMICMGTCLFIIRIYLQWKRTKKCYSPVFVVQLLILFIGFIILPVHLAVKNDLSLLLILCLACIILSLLFALHGVGVIVYRHYYHWIGKEHARERAYDNGGE